MTSKNKNAQIRIRPSERRIILVIGDLAAGWIAVGAAIFIWSRPDWLRFSLEFFQQRVPDWYYLLPFAWIILMFLLYDIRRASRTGDTLKGILISASISLIIYLIVYFTAAPKSMPRLGVAVFILMVSVFTLLWRFTYINLFTERLFMRSVIIIGAGRAGSSLAKIVSEMKPRPFHIVGYIDDDPQKINQFIEGFPVLGTSSQLIEVIDQTQVTDLIFAISKEMRAEMLQTLMKAEENGIEITTMPVMYEELLGRVPIFLLEPEWIVRSFVDYAHAGGLYEVGKRLIDIAGGLIGVILMALMVPFIALVIVLDSGFPVFYSQNRLGKNSRLYKIYKFRSMIQDSEKDGKPTFTIENDNRITRVGRLLRRSHLDEFPQFFSILIGDMSMVGPRAERPELVEHLQNNVPFYRARLLVNPGLTGWAQIHQKYASNLNETGVKLEYDLYYIKNRNMFLDLSILLRTIGEVIGFRGR